MFESGIEVSWPVMTLYDDSVGKPLVYREDGRYINLALEPVQNAYKVVCGLQCGKIEADEEILQKFDLNQNKQNE